MKFKKLIFILFFLGIFFPAIGQAAIVDVYFFHTDGCPHCAKEALWLDKLEDQYDSRVAIKRFEVGKNRENLSILIDFGQELNADISGVPFTVIGDQYFSGYYNDQITGQKIKDQIDLLLSIQNNQPITPPSFQILDDNTTTPVATANQDNFDIPFLGNIDIKKFSLPALTIILGVLDGFNPCAMWVLLFLISLLLNMKDHRRMWILGIAFIFVSAMVYYIFMAAWLNIILLLGFIIWVRLIIGLIALLGGGYNLKEFFTNKGSSCKVTGQEKRRRVFDKLKNITQQHNFWLALVGIILLAFAVNIVELICSAGLPAVYTQVLAINDLATWQYYVYILLYIFFFMIDDLFIFIIAMLTLRITGISTKYSRISHLVGGILMVLIGLLLILKPEWLMFG